MTTPSDEEIAEVIGLEDTGKFHRSASEDWLHPSFGVACPDCEGSRLEQHGDEPEGPAGCPTCHGFGRMAPGTRDSILRRRMEAQMQEVIVTEYVTLPIIFAFAREEGKLTDEQLGALLRGWLKANSDEPEDLGARYRDRMQQEMFLSDEDEAAIHKALEGT